MLSLPNLDAVVALSLKVEPMLDHLSYPGVAEITVIGDSRDDADQVCVALRGRIDRRFFLLPVDRQVINNTKVSRGKTRAMVILTDRLLLGTQVIQSLQMSLMFAVSAAAATAGLNHSKQLIVDLGGNQFYRN